MNDSFAELKTRLAEIHDIRRAQEVLFWDQTVMMPPGGGPVRNEQLTTLDRVAHGRFVDDETGRLLDELEDYEQSLDYDSDEASLLRTTRRDWSKARRIPAELAAEMVMAAAEGHDIWAKAREEDDYASFMPHLEKTIELKRRYVDCFDGYDEPYDVLLDDFEPGMKTAEVRAVFDELKAALVPLIAEVGSSEPEEEFMSGPFPIDAQHAFSLRVIERFGLRPAVLPARPHRSPLRRQLRHPGHPPDDAVQGGRHHVRLHGDARVRPRALRARRLAEPRAHPALPRRLVGPARVAEPALGEHRRPQPAVLELLLPPAAGGVPAGARRGRAGELLPRHQPRAPVVHPRRRGRGDLQPPHHPALRARAGADGGQDRPPRAPRVWKARFEEYFGIPCPDDRLGILQDVHWSGGGFGYFPTYTLGNIVSVQIWDKVSSEIPDLHDQFERGEFGQLHEWLRSNLYSLGRKFTPQETLERVVGGPIDAKPYSRYLREKLGTLAAA